MRLSYLLLALPLAFQAVHAEEAKTETIAEKILSQGVPVGAYKMLMDYIKEHHGQDYLQEVYGCPSYVKEETKEVVKEEPKKEDPKDAKKTDDKTVAKAEETKPVVAKSDTKAEAKPAPKDAKTDATKKDAKPVEKTKVKVTYREIAPTGPTVKPCDENKRVRMTKKVKFEMPSWIGIVDFSQPSTTRRFFLINMKTGEVMKYYVAHGKGSGNSNYPTKFSNRKDSLQTSLGIYLAGETYQGSYGDTLRLYGLQRSNDQAFNRDIVVHGAWYVGEDFINSVNSQTKKKYGRLGVSWGCPALGLGVAPKIIGLLKNGGMLLHYHPDLMEKAQSGHEVSIPAPIEAPVVAPAVPAAPNAPAATTAPQTPVAGEAPATAPADKTPTAATGATVAETSSETKTSTETTGSN